MAFATNQRFASSEIRGIVALRLGQLVALGFVGAAVLLALALISYNPQDPSLNTATGRAATNTLGLAGAGMADLLLQGFGAAAPLPAVALLGWAARMAVGRRWHGSGRIVALLTALPIASAALAAALPFVPWPTSAGPGGAIGTALASALASMGATVLGPFGPPVALGLSSLLAFILIILAIGLSAGQWRAGTSRATGLARDGLVAAGESTRAVAALAQRARVSPTPAPWSTLPPLEAPAAPHSPAPPAAPFLRQPEQERPDQRAPDPQTPDQRGERRGVAPVPPRPAERPHDLPAMPDPNLRPRIAVPPARMPAPRQETLPLAENGWQFPPLSLLSPAPASAPSAPSEDALQANARLLETVLGDYGVQGVIREIRPGPVVTLYELEPAPGIRSARVIGLADDIARSLCVAAVRIATVSGRNVIGIEVPNRTRETVYLRELMQSDDWVANPGKLPLALGKDIAGTPVIADLARMPHLLIAGTTGSGKSVGINAMILSILFRLSPDQCRLIMIDPKMLELSVYEGIPHLLAPVVTEPAKAIVALKWTTREMERRYRAITALGVRSLAAYNEKVSEHLARGTVPTRRVQTGFDAETGKPIHEEQELALKLLPFIVVIIDEMSDLMMTAGKEVEAAVLRLAQMARAAGIHVIMATQRPSVDVITGTIKSNLGTRISYQVTSKFDSVTILGERGAEQLLGMGDLLHKETGGRIARVHGPFVRDDEVRDVVDFLRAQAEPAYDDEVTESEPDSAAAAAPLDGDHSLFDQAVDLVTREGKASTSFIQRHLSIGYNRAAKLVEQMEREGIITQANHAGKREVLTRRPGPDED